MAAELWLGIRRLKMWTATPGGRRSALFDCQRHEWIRARQAQAAAEAPEIAPAVKVVADFPCVPETLDGESLAQACHAIAEWAAENGHTETAVQYAEAAASIGATADQALLAGRLTRNCGDFARAELWFGRGIAAARNSGDAAAFIRGHLGYGILCMAAGREACARRYLNTASVYAMQQGYEWLAAEAQHDLFHFMVIRGDLQTAEMHARRALAWYPKHHPRFPFFAMDAGFLLVCMAQYHAAGRLLREALRLVVRPSDTVLGLSVLIRALAGAGDVREFRRMARRLEDLLARHAEYEAAARWNLAEAQRAAGLTEQARTSAELSLQLAEADDPETAQFARDLLHQLANGVPAPAQQGGEAPYLALVESLITRLREWTPDRRGRTRSIRREEWAA